MNILHVGTGNMFGGVEQNLLTLARAARYCPEMTPHFVACFEGRLLDDLRAANASCHRLNDMRGRTLKHVISNRTRLRKLQESLKVETIVYHSLWSWALLGVGLRSRARTALWFHDAVQQVHLTEQICRLQMPDTIIANSAYTASTVSKIYRAARPQIVHPPVCDSAQNGEPTVTRHLRESLKTAAEDVVIVQVSRLERYKGQKLHIEALAKLRHLNGWKAWLVGGIQRSCEISYLEELQNMVLRLGLEDHVHFLGQRSDVPNILAAADIHCQPNIGPEPFGLTFVEAMSAGLPVVTTRIGAAPEIVNSDCGILVEPNDSAALAEALRTLIVDPVRRSQLGIEARLRAKEICDPGKRLRDLLEILKMDRMSARRNGQERRESRSRPPFSRSSALTRDSD
ncbi:MAG: glycosyltransferase family 4 protein [Bryobacteraceae bacterium]